MEDETHEDVFFMFLPYNLLCKRTTFLVLILLASFPNELVVFELKDEYKRIWGKWYTYIFLKEYEENDAHTYFCVNIYVVYGGNSRLDIVRYVPSFL